MTSPELVRLLEDRHRRQLEGHFMPKRNASGFIHIGDLALVILAVMPLQIGSAHV